MILDTDTREVEGFTFTIETWADEDSDSPRDWDNQAYFYIVSDHGYSTVGLTVDLDELTDSVTDDSAGHALREIIQGHIGDDAGILRRFHLWQALNPTERNRWRLFDGSGHGYSRGDYHEYFALVDTLWDGSDPRDVVRQENEDYSTWRYGGVRGVTVTLNGKFIDSCGGFYSEEAIEDFVSEIIEHHFESLTEQANSGGAGFVGVI